MSDHREHLVDLSTTAAGAPERSDALLGWLRTSGWSREQAGASDWLATEGRTDVFGPTALARFPGLAEGTVTVGGSRHGGWFAGQGDGAVRCPSCGDESLDGFELLDEWQASGEPRATCPTCGLDALLGDLDLTDAGALGSLAITLEVELGAGGVGPDDVVRALLADLRDAVGGRWARVHLHL